MTQTIADRIAQAEQARDDLLAGRARLELRQGDEAVRFQPADLAALDRHIEDLKAQAGVGRRRAIAVRFR
jgi:hypothetical protein